MRTFTFATVVFAVDITDHVFKKMTMNRFVSRFSLLVAFLYYYDMSAQLKTLVDRFCAFKDSIQRKYMKSALISAAKNSDS